MDILLKYTKRIPQHIWILSVIVLLGIFLRVYNFHDWLAFRGDQIRDAYLVNDVVTEKAPLPLSGPFMSFSGDGNHSEDNAFHVGPIYYYFQIISAELFGNYPDKLGYPDVFFAILSIPLFFYFLRLYFDRKISLLLVSIYAVSGYLIHYSRFAWSCNPIPFFVILFLYSLIKVLENNAKKSWLWPVVLGIAFGVGFQLHALTMILFSATVFFVFVYSMKTKTVTWKKWAIVFAVFVVLNVPQIINETRINFANAKILLGAVKKDGGENAHSKAELLKNDLECTAQANFLYLTSHGSSLDRSNCTHSFYGAFEKKSSFLLSVRKNADKIGIILLGYLLSVFGYVLLYRYTKKEKKEAGKYFLEVVALYLILGFFLMVPLSTGDMNDLRYFSFVFFVPFLFLGLAIKWLFEKISYRKALGISLVAAGILIFSNMRSLISEQSILAHKNGSCSNYMTLGEIEPIAQYIESQTKDGEAFFGGDKSLPLVYQPLEYFMYTKGVRSQQIKTDASSVPAGKEAFYLSCSSKLKNTYAHQKFGTIYVYQIQNKLK